MEQRGAHGLDFERSAAEAATAGAARPAGTAFGLRALPCASPGRPRCSSEQDHTRLPGSVDDGVLAALGCFRVFSFEEVYHGCVRTRCFGGRGPARHAKVCVPDITHSSWVPLRAELGAIIPRLRVRGVSKWARHACAQSVSRCCAPGRSVQRLADTAGASAGLARAERNSNWLVVFLGFGGGSPSAAPSARESSAKEHAARKCLVRQTS